MQDVAIIPRTPRAGDVIAGQYVLGPELGRGSMGVVYEAHQRGLERRVALKMLLPRALVIDGVVERFQRGARLASSLTHPNAVIIHTYGIHEDPDGGALPFMAMEHLEGEDLYDYITRKGRLTVEETVRVARQALGSLAEAHTKGIIHRDLKPENLFMSRRDDGQRVVKVLDFGLAKAVMEGWESRERRLTATGMTCGTPEYMAPEQAVGEENITPALDIYGMGCILYHMIVGEPPFRGTSPMTIALKHVTEPPPRLPAEHQGTYLDHVVRRCLAKRPEVRFRDARELDKALEEGASGVDLTTTPGWPHEKALTRNYRLGPGETFETLTETNQPVWTGTQEVTPVPSTAPQDFRGVPMPPHDSLQADTPSEDEEESQTVTIRTNVGNLNLPDPELSSIKLKPGSVSVNLPVGGVSVDLQADGVVDYSNAAGARTLITGRHGTPPLNEAVDDNPSRRARVKAAPVASEPHEAAVAPPPGKKSAPPPEQGQNALVVWIMIALGVLLLSVALGLTLFIVVPRSGDGGDKAEQAEKPAEVTIRIESTPSKARVFEDDKLIGKTPLTLKRPRAKKTVRLYFRHSGYEDTSEMVPLTDDARISVELSRTSDSGDWTKDD